MKKWAIVIGVMLFFAVKICSYSMETTTKLEDDKDTTETSFSSFHAQEGLIGVPIHRIAAQQENQLLDILQNTNLLIPSTLELVKNGASNLLEGHYSLQTNFKRLHELMAAFAQLPTARVGQGYEHPTAPNMDLEAETDAFLEAHPFLNAFPNYVQFLKSYAGAAFHAPDGSIFIDIFGFIDTVTLTVTDEESPIISEEGYYIFCTGLVTTKSELETKEDYFAFGFDATGNRKKGIYEYVTRKDGQSYYFLCNRSFLSWLEEAFVERLNLKM